MALAEHFSVDRLKRCATIQMAIMHAARTNRGEFNFTVHLTEEPSEETTIAQIERSYVAIGVADTLIEVPFIDLLVIITMIEQEIEAWKAAEGKQLGQKMKMRIEFPTAFSDDEIVRLLSCVVFETPSGKKVRLS